MFNVPTAQKNTQARVAKSPENVADKVAVKQGEEMVVN